MATLKDISKYTGISVTQVSRALNGHSDVSEETKIKVLKAAKKMGYVKNTAAQRLVTQKSNQLVFIIVGSENDIPNNIVNSSIYTMMKGVNEYSLENDQENIIYMLPKEERSYVDFMQRRGLEGAIIAGLDYDDSSINELLESDLACVLIDIPVKGKNNGCILINNTYFTSQAVQALMNSGKKQIAMLNGAIHSMVSVERESGYRIAHISNQLPYDPELVVCAEWSLDVAYNETKRLLEEHSDIDGFFCSSDFMAIGCLNAVKEMGYKVPEDIGIIGFDGIPQIEYTDPPLATVIQNNFQKGYRAAELLNDILSGKSSGARSIIIDCDLHLKNSI